MDVPFENLEKIDEMLSLLKEIKETQQLGKRWLNINETSEYLGYSKDYIHKLKDDEFLEGKHYYKKGKLLFDKLELDKWVQNSKTKIQSKEIVNKILKDLI